MTKDLDETVEMKILELSRMIREFIEKLPSAPPISVCGQQAF
jgi:hypothetical protein